MIQSLLGYFINIIKGSKGMANASDEMSLAIWNWMRPIFLKDDIESKPLVDLKADPENDLNIQSAMIEIQKYLRENPNKESELINLLEQLKTSGLKSANISMNHFGQGDIVGRDKIVTKTNK